MTEAERRKAIEYLVYDIYMPQVTHALGTFLSQYRETMRQSFIISQAMGMPVTGQTLQFDLRPLNEQLIGELVKCDFLFKPEQKTDV